MPDTPGSSQQGRWASVATPPRRPLGTPSAWRPSSGRRWWGTMTTRRRSGPPPTPTTPWPPGGPPPWRRTPTRSKVALLALGHLPRAPCCVRPFSCLLQIWPCDHVFLQPWLTLAWLTPGLISIYIEKRSGNHAFIFSYLRRGLRLPGADNWALRMSIIWVCT